MRKKFNNRQPAKPDTPYQIKPDYDMYPEREQVRAAGGPNLWDVVRKNQKNFGKNFDFRILDENVLFPTCRACQEWIYAMFPEDSTYYTLAPDQDGNEWVGVVVDRGLDIVLDAADRDGLISEDEYVANMENEQTINQGYED